MELFARESGSGDEPIVLLHGFGGTHAIWRKVIPLLAPTHRMIAYDLPGHGKSSDWPEAGTPGVAARAVLADLDRRGVEMAHFAGHSMGGAIGVLIAMEAPDRVASLSLFAPGGFGPEINARLLARLAAAEKSDDIRACLQDMSGWDSVIDEEDVAAVQPSRATDDQRARLVELAGRISRNGRQGAFPRETLEKFVMPVSVVWGTADNVLPVSQASGLPPAFALHPVPGIGHRLPEEVPDLVARLIARNAR